MMDHVGRVSDPPTIPAFGWRSDSALRYVSCRNPLLIVIQSRSQSRLRDENERGICSYERENSSHKREPRSRQEYSNAVKLFRTSSPRLSAQLRPSHPRLPQASASASFESTPLTKPLVACATRFAKTPDRTTEQ